MARYLLKYNPGGQPISGAIQVKTLAVAMGDVDTSAGGWYGGVDDDGVYLITCDTTTLGLAGRPTGNGTGVAPANVPTIWRTTERTDAALISLLNRLPGSPRNITNITQASEFLNSSNYGIQPNSFIVAENMVSLQASLLDVANVVLYKNNNQYLQINSIGSNQVSGTLGTGDVYYVDVDSPEPNVVISIEIVSSVSGVIYDKLTRFGALISPEFTNAASEDIYITVTCRRGGPACPTPEMLIYIGENEWKTAGELVIGDLVYTQHQHTNEWGYYEVTFVKRAIEKNIISTFIGDKEIKVSDLHRFLTPSGEYLHIKDLSVGDLVETLDGPMEITSKKDLGSMEVVKIEVNDAHTYVLEGVISHNIKELEPNPNP